MQVNKLSNKNNASFGANITTETVKRANRTLIERGKLARRQGLELAEYNALHREDFVKRIGAKTFDFYAMAERLTSDIEKLKKAFASAFKRHVR
ncbi:hypothetical protein IJ384_02050 [bacterium]|nr:hypothetical protein [bacterium]